MASELPIVPIVEPIRLTRYLSAGRFNPLTLIVMRVAVVCVICDACNVIATSSAVSKRPSGPARTSNTEAGLMELAENGALKSTVMVPCVVKATEFGAGDMAVTVNAWTEETYVINSQQPAACSERVDINLFMGRVPWIAKRGRFSSITLIPILLLRNERLAAVNL